MRYFSYFLGRRALSYLLAGLFLCMALYSWHAQCTFFFQRVRHLTSIADLVSGDRLLPVEKSIPTGPRLVASVPDEMLTDADRLFVSHFPPLMEDLLSKAPQTMRIVFLARVVHTLPGVHTTCSRKRTLDYMHLQDGQVPYPLRQMTSL